MANATMLPSHPAKQGKLFCAEPPAELLQCLADPACLLDADACVIDANEAWAELVSRPRSILIGASCLDDVQHEDQSAFVQAFGTLRSGTVVRDALHRFLTASGEVCFVQWSGRPLAGRAVACIVARNVTQERQRVAELQASAEFNQRLLHSSQDCIKVLDTEGRLLSMTPIGRTLLEIPDGMEVLGRRWPDFWQGDERLMAERAVTNALEGRSTQFSGFCPTMTGVPKWWDIAVSPIHDSSGVARLLVVSHDITPQKANEEIIRRSKDQFQILTELLPQVVWMADAAGHLNYINPRWQALTGFDASETMGMGWLDAVEPSHRERIRAAWQAACHELSDYETEAPLFHAADGKYRWHLLKGLPVRDADGLAVHWVGIALDIDERRKVHEAIETLARRFRFLAESIPQKIFTADTVGKLDYCNGPWLDYSSVPMDALCGYGWLDWVHPDDAERTRRRWEKSIASGELFEHEHRLKQADGTYHWHLGRARPMHDETGKIVMWVGSHTDIHDIKQSEAALRLSEIRYRSLATSSAGIVWSCTPELEMDGAVPSWEHYTGQPFAQYRQSGWRHAIHPDDIDELDALWTASMRSLRLLELRCRLKRHDGSWRVNLIRGVPVLDETGAILEWVCTAVDIHDRSEAQRQLEIAVASERAARAEAERIGRVKDEFLATLSHELRTPLNAILGWSQILQRKVDDAEAVARGIAVIDRNVRVQTRLIEDLLDMSGIISGKIRLERKPVPIDEVLQAAIESVGPSATSKNIRIKKDFPPVSSLVHADVGRLQQVFWNLLTNAIKFTPLGGIIHATILQNAHSVTVGIADNGEGIAPEFLPRVFERFTQGDASIKRRHGGLGVGLSIVRTLAEMHGGSVRAESRGIGRGATFYVTLPALPSAADGATDGSGTLAPHYAADASSLEGKRVLVIDDEADARELLERLLEECGAVTRQAASAAEAYFEVERFQPDLILCDIGMPVVDGYQFIRTLRQQGVAVPAAALTAFAREEDRLRSLQAGFQTHLTKPVEASILFHTIANLSQTD